MDARLLAVFSAFLIGLALVVVWAQDREAYREGACSTGSQQPAAPAAPQYRIVPLDITRLV